jgi:uncharacterized membrane protein YdcZ (DUF606 family)
MLDHQGIGSVAKPCLTLLGFAGALMIVAGLLFDADRHKAGRLE